MPSKNVSTLVNKINNVLQSEDSLLDVNESVNILLKINEQLQKEVDLMGSFEEIIKHYEFLNPDDIKGFRGGAKIRGTHDVNIMDVRMILKAADYDFFVDALLNKDNDALKKYHYRLSTDLVNATEYYKSIKSGVSRLIEKKESLGDMVTNSIVNNVNDVAYFTANAADMKNLKELKFFANKSFNHFDNINFQSLSDFNDDVPDSDSKDLQNQVNDIKKSLIDIMHSKEPGPELLHTLSYLSDNIITLNEDLQALFPDIKLNLNTDMYFAGEDKNILRNKSWKTLLKKTLIKSGSLIETLRKRDILPDEIEKIDDVDKKVSEVSMMLKKLRYVPTGVFCDGHISKTAHKKLMKSDASTVRFLKSLDSLIDGRLLKFGTRKGTGGFTGVLNEIVTSFEIFNRSLSEMFSFNEDVQQGIEDSHSKNIQMATDYCYESFDRIEQYQQHMESGKRFEPKNIIHFKGVFKSLRNAHENPYVNKWEYSSLQYKLNTIGKLLSSKEPVEFDTNNIKQRISVSVNKIYDLIDARNFSKAYEEIKTFKEIISLLNTTLEHIDDSRFVIAVDESVKIKPIKRNSYYDKFKPSFVNVVEISNKDIEKTLAKIVKKNLVLKNLVSVMLEKNVSAKDVQKAIKDIKDHGSILTDKDYISLCKQDDLVIGKWGVAYDEDRMLRSIERVEQTLTGADFDGEKNKMDIMILTGVAGSIVRTVDKGIGFLDKLKANERDQENQLSA